MKQKWTNVLLWIVGTELVGALSAILAGGNFSAYYRSLDLPPFAPPGWLFPVMWVILYGLMGISAFLIHESTSLRKKSALILYGAQLLANFLWSPIFFGLKWLPGAAADAAVMLVLVMAMIAAFFRIRRSAAFLNIPYLLWTMFAVYLSFGVLVRN